jgi:adenosylcobinamide-phosphate synthase
MTVSGLAAGVAWAVDQRLGEPPTSWHPVAWFGRTMRRVETVTYRDDRTAGMAHLAVGVGLALGAATLLRRLLGRDLATVVATTVAIAGKMLADEAAGVLTSVAAHDIGDARRRVAGLVGRDVSNARPDEIVRAVLETTAENTIDAVTAPLLYAAVGGAHAVLVHRAINTLDAMVGHRNERYRNFGWGAARADDLVNWAPARVTAVAVAIVKPRRISNIVRAIRHDAGQHPSPNGGVIEASFAAALGVRLGGANRYGTVVENRGLLGDGMPPSTDDGFRAIGLARRASAVIALGCCATTVIRQIPAFRRRNVVRSTGLPPQSI